METITKTRCTKRSNTEKKSASNIGRRHSQTETNTHSVDLIQRSIGNQSMLYHQGVGNLARSVTSNDLCIQTKLKIGAADDKYEQEADRIATQVMTMPVDRYQPEYSTASISSTSIQRTCKTCQNGLSNDDEIPAGIQTLSAGFSPGLQRDAIEKEHNEQPGVVQTKAQSSSLAQTQSSLDSHAQGLPASAQGLMQGGAPLSPSVKGFFESRMGRDLRDVRVHTGETSSRHNAALNAHAFTIGHHVWLGQGASPSPSLLMAHELAHVVQQRQPPQLQRATKAGQNNTQNDPQSSVTTPADNSSTIRRAEFYWVPVGINKAMTGPLIHKELEAKLAPPDKPVDTEVGIPNADRYGNLGLGISGQADFYQSSPAKRIGVKFVTDPLGVVNCADGKPLGKAETLKGGGKTGQPKQRKGKLSGITKAPDTITLGELKPASKSQVNFGKRQLANYEKGIKFARNQTNCWSRKVNKGTDEWPDISFNRFDNTTLPITGDYVFNASAPLTNRNLAVATFRGAGEGVDVVFNPLTELRKPVKGGLYAKHTGKGVIAYFARPADPAAAISSPGVTTLKSAYANEATQLQNEVITPLKTGPVVQGLFRHRKSVLTKAPIFSADRTVALRTKKPKPPPKLVDPFPGIHSRWKTQHSNFSKSFKKGSNSQNQKALRFLELAYQTEASSDSAGVPKTSKRLPPRTASSITIPAKAGSKAKATTRQLPGLYSWMRAWSNPGIKFLGRLRKTFGGTFVWVANKVRDLRARLQGRIDGQRNKSKGGKSYAAIAIRAFWKAAVKIGGLLFRNTIKLLVQSLGQGLKNKMRALIPHDAQSLQQAVDGNFPQLKKIQIELENIKSTIKSKIEEVVTWFDTKFKGLIEFAKKARRYGKYIKWGMVILQCVSPPGWGCLKLFAKRLIASLIEEILNLCEVKKKFQSLVLATGWFNDIPKDLALGVANKVDALLPSKISPVFDKGVLKSAGAPRAEDLDCDSEPSGKYLAFLQLQQELEDKYGPDGYKAFIAAIKEYGIPDDRELSSEDIQKVRDDFLKSDVDPVMLREYLKSNPRKAFKNPKVVDMVDFLQHVKKTIRKARVKAAAKSVKKGGLKKMFAKLKPGQFYILPFTNEEIVAGKATSKQTIRRGTKGEAVKQAGVVDVSIDSSSLDCKKNTIDMTMVRVELFDTKGNPVTTAGLKGTTQKIRLDVGDWKDKLCKP